MLVKRWSNVAVARELQSRFSSCVCTCQPLRVCMCVAAAALVDHARWCTNAAHTPDQTHRPSDMARCVVSLTEPAGAAGAKQQHEPEQEYEQQGTAPSADRDAAAAITMEAGVVLQPVQAGALVAAADMYALQPKAASVAGGLLTVLALVAALAYTTFQVIDYSQMPPLTSSDVQWSDTQGPFPATIRCTAPGGCWVSNRHNDRWSSNGAAVEAAQQGCLVLAAGQEHVMNVTFTQNVANGLVVVWDPAAWDSTTTPGSGFVVLAETNVPAAPGGVSILATPVLGGTYLASYVETHNHSVRAATAARLRREWFVTYVSSATDVVPAATACAGQLTSSQLLAYTQATIRMQSAWYRVSVTPPDLLLTLVGNCGGALQLCLQAGAIALLVYELVRDKAPRWVLLLQRTRRQVLAHVSTEDSEPGHQPVLGGQPPGSAGLQPYSLTGHVFVNEHTGQHFALLSPGHQQAAAAPRGLAWLSLSGSGGVATALRGLSVGGHLRSAAQGKAQAADGELPGVLLLSCSGDGGGPVAAGLRHA